MIDDDNNHYDYDDKNHDDDGFWTDLAEWHSGKNYKPALLLSAQVNVDDFADGHAEYFGDITDMVKLFNATDDYLMLLMILQCNIRTTMMIMIMRMRQ